MATKKQIEANQENAAKSSGPKTSAGKAASSKNAMKTGLLSRELILPGESQAEFDALFDQLVLEHNPGGVLEMTLLERVAVAMWRQRRMVRAERARLEKQQSNPGVANRMQLEAIAGRDNSEALIQRAMQGKGLLSADEIKILSELASGIKSLPKAIEELAERFPHTQTYLNQRMQRVKTDNLADFLKIEKYSSLSEWMYGLYQSYIRKLAVQEEAAKMRDSNLIPMNVDLISRYQATLDNEWYKAIRAFREAQNHRLKTIEQINPVGMNKE
jgi:hypothetical protein